MDHNEYSHAGWAGPIIAFLKIDETDLIRSLEKGHLQRMNAHPSEAQLTAWHNCIGVLKETFERVVAANVRAEKWSIVFEYELPRERGRGPDVLLLTNKRIFVLGFKDTNKVHESHLDRVAAQARDLENYHERTQGMAVIPILVPTLSKLNGRVVKEVIVAPPLHLAKVLLTNAANDEAPADLESWLGSGYAPLPSLVEAARAYSAMNRCRTSSGPAARAFLPP